LLLSLNYSQLKTVIQSPENVENTEELDSLSVVPEEVGELIDQNIQINSNKQMREEYLNPWTLKFKEPLQEVCFCQLREDMFRSNMLCMFIVWIFIVMCQFVIIPRCSYLTITLIVTTCIISAGCVLVMAEEFRGLYLCLQELSASLVHDRNRRTIFVAVTVTLMSAASSIALIMCFPDAKPKIFIDLFAAFFNETSTMIESNATIELFSNNTIECLECDAIKNQPSCYHPEYVVFSWALCLIALATALKLYYLVKMQLAVGLVSIFCFLILAVYPDIFNKYDEDQDIQVGITLPTQMVILLLAFLTMVIHHARLVEVTARLDFIWKEEAERELSNMKSNRHLNDLLIKNILPEHVASFYLSHEMSDDIYSKSHDLCGVMFASIPNFKDFYSEDVENGKACIRVLNEIICDFDALLDEPRFATVEKIKTVGQ